MPLKKQMEEKLTQALKDKDKNTYPTLRLVISAIKDNEIANRTKGSEEVTDSDIMTILRKMIKQRKESCEAYKKAGRHELLEIESKEIDIISFFLPKQLNEIETKKACLEAIKAVGANSMKDMGKVMGHLKTKYSDVLDFSKVNTIIKESLK